MGILLQTFNQFVIVAQFYANRAYIAKNLCENRDKPQLHCEGQCCLKKRLAQEAKDQAASSSEQKSKETVTLYFAATDFHVNHLPVFASVTEYVEFNELRTSSFQKDTFRPPSV
jgi:phosphatidylserine decarboxylase